MRRPAVFFDRDNTLIAGNEYLGDPAGVVLVPRAAEAVARVRRMGFAAVVVSNQSGVARGMFTEDAVRSVNARMDELLRADDADAIIDRHEYCPYHPDGTVELYRRDSDLRKPRPGMILLAADRMAIDLSRSWLVGDAPRDVEAGAAAGCRTILVVDPTLAASPAAAAEQKVRPDFVVASLLEAVEVIEREHVPAPWNGSTRPVEVVAADRGDDETIDVDAEPSMPSGLTADTLVGENDATPASSERDDVTREVAPTTRVADPDERPQWNGPAAPRTQEPTPAVSPVAAAVPPAQPAAAPKPTPPTPPPAGELVGEVAKLQKSMDQILHELRRRHETPAADFSVSKLIAGITQVIALAVLFIAYLSRGNPAQLTTLLLLAIYLQTLTIALLGMDRGVR
jgi:D-glycero-D-manno-heptose 1,7-bisphosphate phosphatase